jgi:hypothetical protein
MEQLNGRRIIVKHPELIKPWVPIDFLPGYESTQNFIGKDGKCLFRAFAHLKYGQQDLYEQVWDEIIEYMRANVDHFGPFMTGDESNHMKVQRRIAELEGGAWGDHHEITAFVELTKLNLIVISKAERSVNVEVFTSEDASDIYNAVLLESEHYELARQGKHIFFVSPMRLTTTRVLICHTCANQSLSRNLHPFKLPHYVHHTKSKHKPEACEPQVCQTPATSKPKWLDAIPQPEASMRIFSSRP